MYIVYILHYYHCIHIHLHLLVIYCLNIIILQISAPNKDGARRLYRCQVKGFGASRAACQLLERTFLKSEGMDSDLSCTEPETHPDEVQSDHEVNDAVLPDAVADAADASSSDSDTEAPEKPRVPRRRKSLPDKDKPVVSGNNCN